MPAGDQRQRLFEVGAQFVRRAGLAGVVAGDREPAAEFVARVFESADVVALPAMQGDRDRRHFLECAATSTPSASIPFLGE